jgi:hypothetical protein
MLRQFSHKNEENSGTILPEKWVNQLSALIQETFPEMQNRKALYWGEYFTNELLLIASIYNEATSKIPYTILLSIEINSTQEKEIKKVLDSATQVLGVIIEDYLTSEEELEYVPTWTENQLQQQKFNYRITREDILLTLEANKLYNL